MNVDGPVMLRPVELDAAAGPRPGEADQRGFDDRLVVDEVVAVGLVLRAMDASAELRQDHHVDEFVFELDRVPGARLGFFRDAVGERQRINPPAAP